MSDIPWKTIAAEIASQIASGDLAPGTRIPSGDQLARERGINRNTAHRAIEELQRQGLVVRRQGSGTIVAERESVSAHRIALLVDGYSPIHNFPSGDLLRGIQERIGEDSSLVIADSKHDPALENRQLKKLARDADGILLYATGLERPSPMLVQLLAEGYPIVALDRVPEGVSLDAVVTDNRAAARDAVLSLAQRGHKRIGFLSFYKPQFSSVVERYEGYREAIKESGLTETVRWMPEYSDRSMPIFHQLVRDTIHSLRTDENPISALFCEEDQIGCSAVLACERLCVSLPEDLELASFSDWHPMTLRTPWNVHRLIQRKFEMGQAAADLLLDRIASPAREPKTVRIAADLVLADAGLQESLVSLTL